MLPPDTLLNDRYRLIESIGEGGMATVYRALDSRLGRTVAIKILHPEYARDRPFLQRFQQEAEFAASLGAHPNIVAIYDVGEDGPLRYIVMELVEGRNLKDLIRERAPFEVAEAFGIGRQVASALDFAHNRGLVHRDVKPQNILVTPDGVAKVTDFGIARGVTTSQLTRTGMVIGTAHYFSPEQAQGKPAAPASDIYALGIVLYEMLTAHLPFDADNPISIAMQHLHSQPPSPWEYNPGLPARAVATVMRALEKDPERRYRDAGEFAAALAVSPAAEAGATTVITPIAPPVREPTTVIRQVEAAPVRRPVVRETRAATPATRVVPTSNPWRTTLLILAAALLIAAIAAGAFLVTRAAVGGGQATATPTASPSPTITATPHPVKHHHKSTPTTAPVVVQPTNTFLPTVPPAPATATATATFAPRPTFTPSPQPATSTSIPTVTPTTAPVPTVQLIGPTVTNTPAG